MPKRKQIKIEKKRSASATLFVTVKLDGQEKTLTAKVELPCNRSDFVMSLVESAVGMADELAFAAGIEFLPQKDLDKELQERLDNEIPY